MAGLSLSLAGRGVSNTCNQMITFMTAVGMIIPSGGRVFAIAREKGEVAKDQEGRDSARHLGKMMVRTIVVIDNLRKNNGTSHP